MYNISVGQTEEASCVHMENKNKAAVTRANGPKASCENDGTTIAIKIVTQQIFEQQIVTREQLSITGDCSRAKSDFCFLFATQTRMQ